MNQVERQQRFVMMKPVVRSFASGDLPPHVKLEMPNLSPTMEKVHQNTLNNQLNIG